MPITTKIDLEHANHPKVNLPICPKCGWYASTTGHVAHRCYPKESAIADKIIEASKPHRGAEDLTQSITRLGYGDRRLVFELANGLSVKFEITGQRIQLEDIHSLGDLSVDQVVRIARALKEIIAS